MAHRVEYYNKQNNSKTTTLPHSKPPKQSTKYPFQQTPTRQSNPPSYMHTKTTPHQPYSFEQQIPPQVSRLKQLDNINVGFGKKENTRWKNVQMKITNMDSIHDKISNLLNMVNNRQSSQIKKNQNYGDKYVPLSGKARQRPMTPQNQQKVKNYQYYAQNKGQNNQTSVFSKERRQLRHNKSSVRVKTTSQYQQSYQQSPYAYKQTNKKQIGNIRSCLNEQDKYGNKKGYQQKLEQLNYEYARSISRKYSNIDLSNKKDQESKKKNVQQDEVDQKVFNVLESPAPAKRQKGTIYHRKTPLREDKNISQQLTRILNKQKPTLSYLDEDSLGKFQRRIQPKYDKYRKYRRQPSPAQQMATQNKNIKTQHSDRHFMPISMMNTPSKRPGLNMVDQQIRRIKDKINQSENNNKKMQQRINGRQRQQQQCSRVGKIRINQTPKSYKRQRQLQHQRQRQRQKFAIKVMPVINDRPNTVAIAQKLLRQIQFDSRVLSQVEEFISLNQENKWAQLSKELMRQGVCLTQPELKALFTNTISIQQNSQNIQFSQLIAQAHKHWQNQVYGCATLRALKNQKFDKTQLDIQGKGYISSDNLVDFIRRYTGRSHSKQDLQLIVNRIKLQQNGYQNEGISFNAFLRIVAI